MVLKCPLDGQLPAVGDAHGEVPIAVDRNLADLDLEYLSHQAPSDDGKRDQITDV